MAQVAYVSSGALARVSTSGSLTGTLPASPTTGNILVAYTTSLAVHTISCSTTGWSQVTLNGAAATGSEALFIAAAGSAAPVFTYSNATVSVKMARIIEVSNSQTSAGSFADATGGQSAA